MFFVSVASSSILFSSELSFLMIMEGAEDLNLHFLASRLALSLVPALHPRYGFLMSTGNRGNTLLLGISLRVQRVSRINM